MSTTIDTKIHNSNIIYNYIKYDCITLDDYFNKLLSEETSFESLIGYLSICQNKKTQYMDDDILFLAKTTDIKYIMLYYNIYKNLDIPINKNNPEILLSSIYINLDNIVLNKNIENIINALCTHSVLNENDIVSWSYNNKYYNIISNQILSIRCHNEYVFIYYKKNKILDDQIKEIIRNDWNEGIIFLLENKIITCNDLFPRLMYLLNNSDNINQLYFEHMKSFIVNILEQYIDDIDEISYYYIKILFPEFYKEKIVNNMNPKNILSKLSNYKLAYLLGFDINNNIPSKYNIKIRLNKLTKIGPDNYYKELAIKTKNWILSKSKQKLSNNHNILIQNEKDTMLELLENYSRSDILFVSTNNKEKTFLHIFTRAEYSDMVKNNKFLNYYTTKKLDYITISKIKLRVNISNSYKLSDTIPLRELYDIYISQNKVIKNDTYKTNKWYVTNSHFGYNLLSNNSSHINTSSSNNSPHINTLSSNTSSINLLSYNQSRINNSYGMINNEITDSISSTTTAIGRDLINVTNEYITNNLDHNIINYSDSTIYSTIVGGSGDVGINIDNIRNSRITSGNIDDQIRGIIIARGPVFPISNNMYYHNNNNNMSYDIETYNDMSELVDSNDYNDMPELVDSNDDNDMPDLDDPYLDIVD